MLEHDEIFLIAKCLDRDLDQNLKNSFTTVISKSFSPLSRIRSNRFLTVTENFEFHGSKDADNISHP